MIDPKIIRENPDRIREELRRRGTKLDLDHFLKLDEARKKQITNLDALRADQNRLGKDVLQSQEGERKKILERLKTIKAEIILKEKECSETEREWNALLLDFPNLSLDDVPLGFDASGNVVIRKWGVPPEFTFQPLPHYEIRSIQPLIDMERGAKVSGNRFWYLKGALAKLEFALMHYAFDFYSRKGFEPMIVPMLVREDALWGTGFFPADANEIYSVNKEEDNLYLIGTAEVPLAAYHMNEVIDVTSSPLKYMGYSSCFRREAGAYGKDLKGILRGHQFSKIEMFVYCLPEESDEMHEFLLSCAEEFVQSLGLHYQVVNMCTGDIGAPNAKKYDIETWMAGQGMYRETHSCSNDTDFQARRLNTKYTDALGTRRLVHTLNNTGSSDRPLIAIAEHYQQADGSVRIPEVLQPYCGFNVIP